MANPSGVDVKGLDHILDAIELKVGNLKRGVKPALNAGADIVQAELEKQSPYDPESGIHMKEHVVKSGIKTDKETGGYYQSVGYPKGIKHRIHVVEFGTINQAPQHFMSDTIERTKLQVTTAIAKTLREVLD